MTFATLWSATKTFFACPHYISYPKRSLIWLAGDFAQTSFFFFVCLTHKIATVFRFRTTDARSLASGHEVTFHSLPKSPKKVTKSRQDGTEWETHSRLLLPPLDQNECSSCFSRPVQALAASTIYFCMAPAFFILHPNAGVGRVLG